ncbi:hypothetical protein DFH09DRAFT_1346413 [Mycena vulgaris]|nr:hypothetical protein DFH09DRAFT_1346413 [Mycena vulgaris]
MSGSGGRSAETPSPQPTVQPSSGPNPVFLPSPDKKRGGQPLSSTSQKRKKGLKKSQGHSVADASRILQEQLAAAAAEKFAEEKAAREAVESQRTIRVQQALHGLKEAGCGTVYQFFEDFFASTDRETSRQASKLMNDHGEALLDLLQAKPPEVVERWALKTSSIVIAAEGKKLGDLLRPDRSRTFTSRLETWSLDELLAEATMAAPNLCELLIHMGMTSDVGRKDNKLVLVTVLCMLAQAENERARQFDVLAHAGLTVSYTKAISDLKGLSAEGLARLRRMVQKKACMIVWDNLNIAFKVAEQRHDSKDTFENGTTATLIVLYGVLRGELELEILPPRTTRKATINFEPLDTLPSVQQVIQTRISALWHIREFLLARFPTLRQKFGQEHGDPPVVKAISLNKMEHLPTPAMKIDESSLDGTIEVIDTTVIRTLQLDEAGMRAHGVMFNGGDLLSLSLTDKAIAARREDTILLDRYLMLKISLPTHILDGFRIYCGTDTLAKWVESASLTWQSIVSVSEAIVDNLCSCSAVEELRLQPESERDPQLENTILCNHDMLILLIFTTAIKAGDVGAVLNCLAHWIVMFRGTGSMPKYADALFELINNIKKWDPALREAYLNNWLVNLTGKIRAFKEVDLLQEHQNFWAKVIYNAKGSNRSWDWLSMVTVVIFNLRDVMRNVQTQFKIPHHGLNHTSPKIDTDLANLQGWLEEHCLQSYVKDRAGKDIILRVRDLMVTGAAYASTPSAFKNFRAEMRNVVFKQQAAAVETNNIDEDEEENDEPETDLLGDAAVEPDDLMQNDEEFISMADELLGMADEIVGIM